MEYETSHHKDMKNPLSRSYIYGKKWYIGLFHHLDRLPVFFFLKKKAFMRKRQVFMSRMHLVVELFVAPMGPNQYKKFQ